MMPETPTTGAVVSTSASRMPGTPRIVPDGDDRVGRRDQHDVGVGDRLEHAGRRLGVLDADRHHGVGGHRGLVADPVLLEVHRPALAGVRVVDHDVGLDPVVGHRQQLDAAPWIGLSQRWHSAAVTALSG